MILDLQTHAQLSAIYGQETRLYHNMYHINFCLTQLADWYRTTVTKETALTRMQKDTIELAIWFHDVVYNPYSKTNEADSAVQFREWADGNQRLLSKMSYDTIPVSTDRIHDIRFRDLVERMILATKNHSMDQDNLTETEQVFLDIDLSIIATNRNTYSNYVASVRREYAYTSDEEYLKYRCEFLAKILNRKRLFYSDYYYEKCEILSCVNLALELKDWQSVRQLVTSRELVKNYQGPDPDDVKQRYGIPVEAATPEAPVDEEFDSAEQDELLMLQEMDNLLGLNE